MVHFKPSQILTESEMVAKQLRKVRLSKGLKLEDIAQRLDINIKYLKALESGDYNRLPAGVYGRNFLREYSIFLGLDHKEILKVFDEERPADQRQKKDIFSRQVVKRRNFLIVPKIIKSFFIILTVLVFVFYLGGYLKKINSAPELSVFEPKKEYLVIAENSVDIFGKTEPEAQVFINGKLILINPDGSFFEKISLKQGLNTVRVVAQKKHGQEAVVEKQILVDDDASQDF